MGVSNFQDILQQKMNDLYHGLGFISAYIDDVQILTEVDCTGHVQKLKLTINKLEGEGLKCNIKNEFFGHTKNEYLGSWVTRDGVKTTNKNIGAINNMKLHTSRKKVRQFISVLNYYLSMWACCLQTLAPLTIIKSH